MLRTIARLVRELARSQPVTTELDESLWSPSGWSTAATGANAGPQFYAVSQPLVEAPETLFAQPSQDEQDLRVAA